MWSKSREGKEKNCSALIHWRSPNVTHMLHGWHGWHVKWVFSRLNIAHCPLERRYQKIGELKEKAVSLPNIMLNVHFIFKHQHCKEHSLGQGDCTLLPFSSPETRCASDHSATFHGPVHVKILEMHLWVIFPGRGKMSKIWHFLFALLWPNGLIFLSCFF